MGKVSTSFVLLASAIAASAGCSAQHPAPIHGAASITRSPAAAATTAPATAPSTPAAPRRHHHTQAAPKPVPYGVECQPAALRLAQGQRMSEATQQETLILTLTNSSRAGCDLQGYPGLSLLTVAGRPLPFHIRWGGDEMLTTAAPVLVPLPPGGTAYIGINKDACVGHYYRAAHIVRVIPPNGYQPLSYDKPHYPIIGYCRAGDPGHTVDVSPVEPTLRGVLSLNLTGVSR